MGIFKKGWGSSLSRRLELRPPLHLKAQAATAIQIADHGFGENADRFGVLGPFQLLLVSQ
jgi:hypothetical protein